MFQNCMEFHPKICCANHFFDMVRKAFFTSANSSSDSGTGLDIFESSILIIQRSSSDQYAISLIGARYTVYFLESIVHYYPAVHRPEKKNGAHFHYFSLLDIRFFQMIYCTGLYE